MAATTTESLLTITPAERVYPTVTGVAGQPWHRSQVTFSIDFHGDRTASAALRWADAPDGLSYWVEIYDRYTLDLTGCYHGAPSRSADGDVIINVDGLDVNCWVPFRLFALGSNGEGIATQLSCLDTLF